MKKCAVLLAMAVTGSVFATNYYLIKSDVAAERNDTTKNSFFCADSWSGTGAIPPSNNDCYYIPAGMVMHTPSMPTNGTPTATIDSKSGRYMNFEGNIYVQSGGTCVWNSVEKELSSDSAVYIRYLTWHLWGGSTLIMADQDPAHSPRVTRLHPSYSKDYSGFQVENTFVDRPAVMKFFPEPWQLKMSEYDSSWFSNPNGRQRFIGRLSFHDDKDHQYLRIERDSVSSGDTGHKLSDTDVPYFYSENVIINSETAEITLRGAPMKGTRRYDMIVALNVCNQASRQTVVLEDWAWFKADYGKWGPTTNSVNLVFKQTPNDEYAGSNRLIFQSTYSGYFYNGKISGGGDVLLKEAVEKPVGSIAYYTFLDTDWNAGNITIASKAKVHFKNVCFPKPTTFTVNNSATDALVFDSFGSKVDPTGANAAAVDFTVEPFASAAAKLKAADKKIPLVINFAEVENYADFVGTWEVAVLANGMTIDDFVITQQRDMVGDSDGKLIEAQVLVRDGKIVYRAKDRHAGSLLIIR